MAGKLKPVKRNGADTTEDVKKVKKAKLPKLSTKETPPGTSLPASTCQVKRKAPRKRATDYFVDEQPKVEEEPATKVTAPKTGGKEHATKLEQDLEGLESDHDAIPPQALDLFGEHSDSDSQSEEVELDSIPRPPQEQLDAAKAIAKASKGREHESEGTGTLYIGRIPHGFYEKQMREYFSQFGTVTRLRLSRNRRTGAAKHYAFIEFESSDVADIVQKTMDKYLMFGHILQVRRVPQEQIHENLWKGANKRYKRIPWGDIQARRNAAPQTREVWRKRITREEARRAKKRKIMDEYGYEFDMPKLKLVDEVPSKAERVAQLGAEEQKQIIDSTSKDAADDASTSKDQPPIDGSTVPPVDFQPSMLVESNKKAVKKGKKRATT